MTDVEVNWDNQVSGTEDWFLFQFFERAMIWKPGTILFIFLFFARMGIQGALGRNLGVYGRVPSRGSTCWPLDPLRKVPTAQAGHYRPQSWLIVSRRPRQGEFSWAQQSFETIIYSSKFLLMPWAVWLVVLGPYHSVTLAGIMKYIYAIYWGTMPAGIILSSIALRFIKF